MAGNSNSLKDRQDLLARNQAKWNASQLYASSFLPAFMENYEEKQKKEPNTRFEDK
jgi:hypothetical protein